MRFYLSLCTVFILLFSVMFLAYCQAPTDLPSESGDGNGGTGGGGNPQNGNFDSQVSRIGENFNVEEFFNSTVYIYTLYGDCNSSSSRETYKSCIAACNCPNECKTREDKDVYAGCLKACGKDGCTTKYGIGSGVFESSTTVLTNHHVIRHITDDTFLNIKKESIYPYHIATSIENHSNKLTTLKEFKWYNETDDVALIELNNKLDGYDVPEKGSLSSLKALDELFTIGNPNNIKWVASLGHLTKKKPTVKDCKKERYQNESGQNTTEETGRWTNCILFSIPSGGGNSGGPVFDANGKLVGLLAFGVSTGAYDNLSGGPHIDIIKTHIDKKPNAPTSNSASQQLSMQSERTFNRVFDTGRPSKRQAEEFAKSIRDAVISLQD